MTKGEAKNLETGVVVFPEAFHMDNKSAVSVTEVLIETSVDKSTIRNDVRNRFARLKKSLRKRSISIL